MTLNEPYFMTNKDWYYYDEQHGCYKLTEEATDKATESYHEFYKMLEDK